MLPALDHAFSFVKPGHPLSALVEQARALIQTEPCAEAIRHITGSEQKVTTRTLLKWQSGELRWFYFLLQSKATETPIADRALTILYRPKKNRLELRSFPQDPYLPAIPAYLEQLLGNGPGSPKARDFTVLRYVPQRRLTYRIPDSEEHGRFRIGKFVRQGEIDSAYDKLGWVSAAVKHQRPSFTVSTPLGLDEPHGVFYQSCLAGHNLADLIQSDNFEELLYAVGSMHAEVHRLHVPDVPRWQPDSMWDELRERVAVISYLCPELTPFLNEVYALIEKQAPAIVPEVWTFCHGDFGCHQILKDGDRWSVIDFDECLYSDRYRDIARLLAFLKHNVPFFSEAYHDPAWDAETILEQAHATYLRGYQQRSNEAVNWKRLSWYQLAYEVHYLARTLQRDLFAHAVGFERTIRNIEKLTAQLKSAQGKG
jgi:aminoglycoside phosphotransferase